MSENRVTARESLGRELPVVSAVLVAVVLSSDVVLGSETSVPVEMYLFAFVGAGAYAITSLVFEPKQSGVEVLRLCYRLVGALPLAAGVYLFSNAIVDAESFSSSIAGLSFLSGLFVRLTLRRLGDAAEKLYGVEKEPQLPYESDQRRLTVNADLRRGWQQLAADGDHVSDETRMKAERRLERAGRIVEDQDATTHELSRAGDLSQEALALLDSEPGAPADDEHDSGGPDSSDASAHGLGTTNAS
jgi:hypothetical protein